MKFYLIQSWQLDKILNIANPSPLISPYLLFTFPFQVNTMYVWATNFSKMNLASVSLVNKISVQAFHKSCKWPRCE